MNYGFVIDTRSCIGCHACSTACKSENSVPIGVNRTWVKYVESGQYPDTRRSFQVTRCNHCANPPCVRICPVEAMYQRPDGIVEFNGDACIGCKACLQACPYDAIYIDPDTKTAAKCHFCGHRVENGLEPACVIVCPTHSIIAGDMDDPKSEISRVLAKNDTTVRKPEQGTAPKLFYIQGNDVAMHPSALPRQPAGTMFSDVLDPDGNPAGTDYADATYYEVRLNLDGDDHAPMLHVSQDGARVRTPDTQGDPAGGPIQSGGTMAGHMTSQVGYTVWHRVPWHWQVPAYLVSKSIGAGAFLFMAVGVLTGLWSMPASAALGLSTLGLVGVLVTTALLVADLEHPERFLRILTRPQWRSWLTRGAFILIAFSLVIGTWWLGDVAGVVASMPLPAGVRTALAALALPLGIGTATYTAWLFAQCEGRDLWQSPALPIHLLVQATGMGAAAALWVAPFVDAHEFLAPARWILGVALVLDLALIAGEVGIPHASELAARAAHDIRSGRYRRWFWGGAVVLGHLVPLALVALSGAAPVLAVAGLAAAIGLYAWEHAFVAAPQQIPNS